MTGWMGSNEKLRKQHQTTIKNVRICHLPLARQNITPPPTSSAIHPPFTPPSSKQLQQDTPANSVLSPVCTASLSPLSAGDGKRRVSVLRRQLLDSDTVGSLHRHTDVHSKHLVQLENNWYWAPLPSSLQWNKDALHKYKISRFHLYHVFLTSVCRKDPQYDFSNGTQSNR